MAVMMVVVMVMMMAAGVGGVMVGVLMTVMTATTGVAFNVIVAPVERGGSAS